MDASLDTILHSDKYLCCLITYSLKSTWQLCWVVVFNKYLLLQKIFLKAAVGGLDNKPRSKHMLIYHWKKFTSLCSRLRNLRSKTFMIRSLVFSQARPIAKKENATVKDAVPRWYWCHWSIETRVCNSLVTFYGVKQTVRGQGTDSQIKSFIQGRPTYRTISVPEVENVQLSANEFTCLKKASIPSSESIVSISLLAWGRDYNSRLSKASEKGSCLLGQDTGTRKSLTSWRWGGNRQLQAPKADNT